MRNEVSIGLVCLLVSSSAFAMQPLDETQLGEVTGEGIGATFDNVVIYSGDYGQPDDFRLRLRLTEGSDAESVILSELRFNRSGATPGQANSGGFFGTYDVPFVIGDLRAITEGHIGSIDPEGDGTFVNGSRVHSAFYAGFPAADLTQKKRGVYDWSGNRLGVENRAARNSS